MILVRKIGLNRSLLNTDKTTPFFSVTALLGVEMIWAFVHQVYFRGFEWFACTFLALILISAFYGLSNRSQSLANMSYYSALWIVTLIATGILTYIFATMNLPLWDAKLVRMDEFMGFHWVRFYEFMKTQKIISLILMIAYYSALPQIMFSIIFLSHTKRDDRNNELWWTSLISLILTSVLSGLLPAGGTFFHYSVGLDHAVHLTDLFALRNASASEFVFSDMQGIVTFPSYHTVMALLAIYVYRRTSFFWFVVALNILMLISTPLYGGHYLIDMIGGGFVATVSIYLHRRSQVQSNKAIRPPGIFPSAI